MNGEMFLTLATLSFVIICFFGSIKLKRNTKIRQRADLIFFRNQLPRTRVSVLSAIYVKIVALKCAFLLPPAIWTEKLKQFEVQTKILNKKSSTHIQFLIDFLCIGRILRTLAQTFFQFVQIAGLRYD